MQLGLLNVADYNFVRRAVAAIHSAVQAALHKGDPLTLRLGLRILAALVSHPLCVGAACWLCHWFRYLCMQSLLRCMSC